MELLALMYQKRLTQGLNYAIFSRHLKAMRRNEACISMKNLRKLMLNVLVIPLAGLASITTMIGSAVTFDSQTSHADIQALAVA